MNYVLYNQKIIEKDQVNIDYNDRGYVFGDGVYEVIRVYSKNHYTLDEHLLRLYRSVKEIKLTIPFEFHLLKNKLSELIELNGLDTGIIYLQITRGVAPRAHQFPSLNTSPQLIAYVKAFERPIFHLKNGVKMSVYDDIRWLRCDIKSLNLLGNVLAKQDAIENDCFEALMVRDNIVTEGCSSNFFIVKDGAVFTHPSTNLILNGITRMKIKEICQKTNIPFVEKSFSLEDVFRADESFLSSTTSEIMPVIEVANKKIGNGSLGSITRILQQMFEKDAKI